MRGRGRFGNASVLWILEPTLSGDVTPVQGEVVFTEGEYLKNLTLYSKPDEVKVLKIFDNPLFLYYKYSNNTRGGPEGILTNSASPKFIILFIHALDIF